MSNRKPEFAPLWGLDVKDGELRIGGQPVSLLAERAGATPFFAYGRDLMTRRVEELRTALPERVHLHYAIKANPMPALVQHMAGLVDGLDVASGGELLVALDSGLEPETISFAGPGKTDAELTQAIASGIVINMESHGEMERIAEIAGRPGARPKVAIRVNPDFELKTSGMKMGGGSKQFGIDAEIVPQVLSRLGDLDLEFWGFHIFSGSQNLRADALYEAQEKTLELAAGLAKHAPAPPKMLNIGGGLGIPYFPGDKHLDLTEVGDGLARLLPTLGPEFDDTEIVMELGRFLVGEAGIYVSRVVDKKESRGQIFLITDGGLHHQLAASGNFGQVLRKNYPVAIATRMDGEATESVDIVGCLCTPLDRLGDRMELPKAEVGDLVVLFQSGAYGLTASPTAFLGHPAPIEMLV
ncbi:MAG: pyridoxal-dependent decarboxylase, exosortase A system-associated [Sphingomonadales bacterium]|nr:pyridoxal-dependent decarboxylase, exosortase A system-associated [Sphingomonadales bacterium]